jgi:hypothetical protein
MAVSLSALSTGRTLLSRNIIFLLLVLIYLRCWVIPSYTTACPKVVPVFNKNLLGYGGITSSFLTWEIVEGEWLASRPGRFPEGEKNRVRFEQETKWGPEPVRTMGGGPYSCQNSNPCLPVRSYTDSYLLNVFRWTYQKWNCEVYGSLHYSLIVTNSPLRQQLAMKAYRAWAATLCIHYTLALPVSFTLSCFTIEEEPIYRYWVRSSVWPVADMKKAAELGPAGNPIRQSKLWPFMKLSHLSRFSSIETKASKITWQARWK